MKGIQEKSIKEVFDQRFIIPVYQRHYQWRADQCQQLWEDIMASFEREDKNYFIGSLVVYEEGRKILNVVDGQQRLTTMLLLLKAFHAHFPDKLNGLTPLIHVHSGSFGEDTGNLRIESEVPSKGGQKADQANLREVLKSSKGEIEEYNTDDRKNNNNFQKNLRAFYDLIKEWRLDGHENELKDLVDFILDDVEFCQIIEENSETALRIFNTLNDRGLPLRDEDIIRSHLYAAIMNQKTLSEEEKLKDLGEFVDWWADKEGIIGEILHKYWYIFESKESTHKFTPYREFFSLEIQKRGKTPKEIFNNIKKIDFIMNYREENKEVDYWLQATDCWMRIYDIIKYPCVAYMFQKTGDPQDGECTFSGKSEDVVKIIHETLRMVIPLAITLSRNATNRIESLIKNMCHNIMTDLPLPDLQEQMPDRDEFIQALANPGRFTKGILAVYHLLNEEQQKEGLAPRLWRFEVEHILPRSNQHWDSWGDNYWEYIEHLSNKTLLEKKQNIRALNDYFNRKKERAYKDSPLIDVNKGLMSKPQWTPEECDRRFKDITERLCNFIYG